MHILIYVDNFSSTICSVGCGSDFWLTALDDSEIRHQVPHSVCVYKHVVCY